jgi:predicted P-loop ATPase
MTRTPRCESRGPQKIAAQVTTPRGSVTADNEENSHVSNISTEEFLRNNGIKLNSYARGTHRVRCPWCSDRRSRSGQSDEDLSVTIDDKGACWTCHHCGESGPQKGTGNQDDWFKKTFERWHDYQRADGEPFRRVAVSVTTDVDGKRKKKPTQFRLGKNGRWIAKLTGVSEADKNILYRLPRLIKAIERGDAVLLLEGEKDVETAHRNGFEATSNPGGAAEPNQRPKWKRAFSEQLKGADAVIIPDHDSNGYAHAFAAARDLQGIAKRVRVLKLAAHWPSGECSKGGDLTDWFNAGGTREQLDDLVTSAPDFDGGATKTNGKTAPAADVVPADMQEPDWRGWDKLGAPLRSMHNAMVAMELVGVTAANDTFHNKILIRYHGEAVELQRVVGEVTDGAVIALRKILSDRFGTDFGKEHVRDAIVCVADQHRFDPVCDMLDQAQAQWDGIARLDTMVSEYANCANTPFNRAAMRKTLIAAVRRARRPGCKFDNITVLESEEGWNKSTFWRVLAGDENFKDEPILGLGSREVQEQLSDIWVHESADLAGMRKAEVEKVKAFASRQEDCARAAYGYFPKRQPRHAINVATTNAETYLQSQSGNRRFWPLKVLKRIDVEKLERSRLQLWGEAATLEAKGESLTLDEKLWPAAAIEQEKRRTRDPWEEVLAELPKTVSEEKSYSVKTIQIIHDLGDGREFAAAADLLTYVLKVPIDRQDRHHSMRLAEVMKRHGWERERTVIDGVQRRGFARARSSQPSQPPQLRLVTEN